MTHSTDLQTDRRTKPHPPTSTDGQTDHCGFFILPEFCMLPDQKCARPTACMWAERAIWAAGRYGAAEA
eukprot:6104620-Prymnesium_polylepis.1